MQHLHAVMVGEAGVEVNVAGGDDPVGDGDGGNDDGRAAELSRGGLDYDDDGEGDDKRGYVGEGGCARNEVFIDLQVFQRVYLADEDGEYADPAKIARHRLDPVGIVGLIALL